MNKADLKRIEELLNESIYEYNQREKQIHDLGSIDSENKINKADYLIDLKSYKRQYIAETNTLGDKEVWINCFCNTSEIDWEKAWFLSRMVEVAFSI